jgi:hypothetical protein
LPHMAEFFAKRMEYLQRDFEIRPVHMISPSSAVRYTRGINRQSSGAARAGPCRLRMHA